MRLENVTKQDVEAWRDRLRQGRKPRSVNRQVRNVVAGLNFAVTQRGHIGNREAWRLVHLVDDGEENVAVFLNETLNGNVWPDAQSVRDRIAVDLSNADKLSFLASSSAGRV